MPTNPKKNKLPQDPEQIQQMIDLLQTMLDAQETGDDPEPEVQPKTRRKKVAKKTTKKKTTTRKRTSKIKEEDSSNKFLSMNEFNMYKENPEVAKKLYNQPPMRRRPTKNLVDVTCRVCGKREKVSSSLLYNGTERYKCNKCASSPGN